MQISKIMMMIAMVIIGVASQCQVETPTLCVDPINFLGFGELHNRYAFAMQVFKDSVYVSTLNAVNVPGGIADFFLGEPFETDGGQIYKATPNDKGNINDTSSSIWNWTPVVNGGLYDQWNYGVRKFAVINDFLYAVTGNHVNGMEVWKTENGEDWEVVMDDGNGDVDNTSGRGMGYHDGYIYIGAENRVSGAKMFRRKVVSNGDLDPDSNWEQVISDGLGDVNNYWFSDFTEYNGYLYTGTLNQNGMQLWRTLDGGDAASYERVYETPGFGQADMAAMKLYVYKDKLYIGTMNSAGLFDINLGGASLWVNNDDDGESFVRLFTGGGPGIYRNPFNTYMWYIQEFNNRLYVGTFDMDGFVDEALATGFDLFSSDDPQSGVWILETMNAFGNPGHYGLRSMDVIGDKLIMGTATANEELGCLVFQATYNNDINNNNNKTKTYENHKPYDGRRYNGTYDRLRGIVCKDKRFSKFYGFDKFC